MDDSAAEPSGVVLPFEPRRPPAAKAAEGPPPAATLGEFLDQLAAHGNPLNYPSLVAHYHFSRFPRLLLPGYAQLAEYLTMARAIESPLSHGQLVAWFLERYFPRPIPPEAIASLQGDHGLRQWFDENYGPDASNAFIGPVPAP